MKNGVECVRVGEGSLVDPSVILGHPIRESVNQRQSLGSVGKITIGRNCIIRAGAILYENTSIGDSVQISHYVVVREGAVVGDHCALGNHSVIREGARLGRNVRLQEGVVIAENALIGDDVFFGPNVTLTAGRHMTGALEAAKKLTHEEAARREGLNWKGPSVVIEDEARIGSNAVLLAGVRIGRDAVVAAGSVVSSDVPPGCMVAGNPARILKTPSA